MNTNRRPTTFNPCVANTTTTTTNYYNNNNRRSTTSDENTLQYQHQQYNSYSNYQPPSSKPYDPFQSREILRDVTNSTTSNGSSQRNVMVQQQQPLLKPNSTMIGSTTTFNSQNNIPKHPSQQQQFKTTTYYGQQQRPYNNNQTNTQQQPITLQQHLPQYNNNSTTTSRGVFLPQHSSISNLSNGKMGAKSDIHTTRQKIQHTQQQQQLLSEEELFAPGFNEVYTTLNNNQNNVQAQQQHYRASNTTIPPQVASTCPQVIQSSTNGVDKNRQMLANNVKNTSSFPYSKRDTHQFDAVRYAEQAIFDEDEEMVVEVEEKHNTIPIVPSIGVAVGGGYSATTTSAAVASGYIAPTSVFANPSNTTSISQSSSFFSGYTHCVEDSNNSSFDTTSDEEKEPANLLPAMQPLYYFREHNSGTSTIDASNCNISMPPPATPDDARSMRSVIFASDVEVDVLANMRLGQMNNKPNPRYMETVQTDITANMRCILVDWMNEVSSMYMLIPETLYLAVNILDRALSKLAVRRNKLQAIGVAALFISSKFCEINPPELVEFLYIADDTYGKEEVLAVERRILNELEFELVTVQPYDFIEKFLEICGVVSNPVVKYLTYYICELQLQNYEVNGYPPSVVAASALMISLYLIDFNYWNSELAFCFGFSNQACQGNSSLTPEDERLVVLVNECLSTMFRFYVGMATGKFNFSAVRTKYCHMVFQGVGECTRKIDKEPPFIPSIRGSSTSTGPNYQNNA